MPIHSKTGKLFDNIYLVDTLQFGVHGIVSAFLYWDGETCLIMDVGTSDNVTTMMSTIRKFDIPFSKVVAIVNTHYHFDHGGGALRLWERMVKKNPEFKIMVPQDMHDKMQNATDHLIGARTTFGEFVGSMDPVDEKAYQIVQKDQVLPLNLKNGYAIRLLATPGHCTDHVCPTVFQNNRPHFMHLGEACGTLFHQSKLVSLPTSMPNFVYDEYVKSLSKIKANLPEWVGFCHFGAIHGTEDIQAFFKEHERYMSEFRAEILKAYQEEPTTKHVIEQTKRFWTLDRFDPSLREGNFGEGFLKRLQLALTYGMMVDMGLRQSKYEVVK